jgi:hypothetical protein
MVANRGFDRAFVKFFANVHDGDAAACGNALHRERVVFEDVTKSEVFQGPALNVLLAPGVRAVQCTPLMSRRYEYVACRSSGATSKRTRSGSASS